MNPLIQSKKSAAQLLIALMWLQLFSNAQAVSPPPDGGYPGGNTAEGANALLSLTTGQYNTAVGLNSLSSNTTGTFNTAIGSAALRLNTTGDSNTAMGSYALFSNRLDGNTAVGKLAMLYNTIGDDNTAVGESALIRNTKGVFNTVIGSFTLAYNTTGDNNTAIGWQALNSNTTGSFNSALGNRAGIEVTMADNVICIGAPGANVSDSCYIGNIWQQPGGSQAVYVNSQGKLGAQVSSRRFKDEIKPMKQASEVIYSLKPVSFRYKQEIEPTRPPSFGLIAEDVEKINPDLVIRDKKGKPYSVRYDQVNAMLLNEFLKEHRKVEQERKDLEAALARQQKQIEALAAGLQKVSAQLELNKTAPQTVAGSQ
jgi:trimeric autotransporter adhesin